MKDVMNTVVVFGSALRVKHPGDIDIACSEPLSEADKKLILNWGIKSGLGSLPIDEHKIVYGNSLTLPCLCGVSAKTALPLQGSPNIQWADYWSIPAILRTWGRTPSKACEAWEQLRNMEKSLFNCMIDIGGFKQESFSDWANYITGLQALLSGIAKAPAWYKIAEGVPEGRFLDALAKRGPSATGISWAKLGSSGAGARLLLREHGVETQYGDGYIAYNDAITKFVNR